MNLSRRQLTSSLLLAVILCFSGCLSRPDKVAAPTLDPEAMADGAMSLCDSNGDGEIDSTEIKTAPSLKFAEDDIDTDGNGKISRDELLERFNVYQEVGTGAAAITMHVRKGHAGGDALMGAKIRLVPEPFMADFIEEATGDVIDPSTGLAQVASVPGTPGVRVGMYRVEITHDQMKVPSKYNTNTTLGLEVPPITSAATSKPLVFVIK